MPILQEASLTALKMQAFITKVVGQSGAAKKTSRQCFAMDFVQ